jgi:hypothetical protein
MNQRKKSILQPSGEAFLRCSLCREEIQVSHISPVGAVRYGNENQKIRTATTAAETNSKVTCVLGLIEKAS